MTTPDPRRLANYLPVLDEADDVSRAGAAGVVFEDSYYSVEVDAAGKVTVLVAYEVADDVFEALHASAVGRSRSGRASWRDVRNEGREFSYFPDAAQPEQARGPILVQAEVGQSRAPGRRGDR